jgi:ELWxxDGT repeat protein
MLSTAMVSDVNSSLLSSSPSYIFSIGSTAYFMATDPANGYELWKSDGTAAGTMLVKDIKPGPTGNVPVGWSNPGLPPFANFTDVNGTLFFTANDGTNGEELWKSDGTTAGTVMVRDIYAGSTGSAPTGLTNINGTLYFAANSVSNGIELWKSDGTAAGTVMVKSINFGSGSSSPTGLTNINGMLYFSAFDSFYGTELWKSDGTSAGTVMVKDIYSSGSSSPQNLTNVNGTLFFTAADVTNGNELWKSNGTAAGTVLVKDIYTGTNSSNPNYLTVSNGALFFSANNGVNGTELWKSDGTAGGTVLVKDVNPGSNSSLSAFSVWTNLIDVNGTLVLQADDGVNGLELWKSDGTTAGTVLLKDIWPGGSGLYNPTRIISNQVSINGTLYFSAIDGTNGYELWKSDGTAAGTQLVSDIFPGPGSYNPVNYSAGSSMPAYLANVNGTLFFAASEPTSGTELWKSDGTATGTVLVRDIAGTSSSNPTNLTDVNGTLFFVAGTVANGSELWKSDGTPSGTVMLRDIASGSTSSFPSFLKNVNGTLYFTASTTASGTELWKSDGSTAGTTLVKDINPGSGSSSVSSLTNVNGTLYFTASTTASGIELWKSDGTDAGTVLVKDIMPGTAGSSPSNLANINGTLYFVANDGVNGAELWKSDGTAAGTVLVKDIFPGNGPTGSVEANIMYLTDVNGTLYFTASDGVNGQELWKSDGTSNGTTIVRDIVQGSGSASPTWFLVVDGTLYFTAYLSSSYGFWKSDGTAAGTVLIKDINPILTDISPSNPTNVNGTIYFGSNNGVNGNELWKSDGTTTGTVLVTDINPGAGNSTPWGLVSYNGLLFFQANNGTNGAELWVSDGTAAGTRLIKDIYPGATTSAPTYLTKAGGALYFTATDPFYGNELFRTAIPVASAGGPYSVSPTGSVTLAGSGSVAVGSIVSYQWDFDYNPALGFNVSATGATPTFSGAGLIGPATRTIALRTIDDDGLISTISTTTVNIYENRIVASFVANPNSAAPAQVVVFDASASLQTDPTRTIASYLWDFGDGNTASGSSALVNHSYAQFGTFTVSLTVTDDVSQTASTSLSINVNQGNRAPIASAGGPYSIAVGQSLVLDGSASTDPDIVYGDSIVNYQWDLNNDGLDDVSGVTPSVTWATLTSLGMTLGNFTTSLRVTDTFGVSTITTASLNIFNPAPVIASLSTSPSVVNLGGTVTLTANGVAAVAAGATLAKVEFYRDLNANSLIDVGIDKLLGTDTSATSGWTSKPLTTGWAIGVNTVLARAQDNLGNWSDAVSKTLTINGLPTVGSFVANPTQPLPASLLTLTASSVTDPDGTVAAVEIYFDTNKDGKIGSGEPKLTVTPDGLGNFVANTVTPTVSGSYKYLARAKDNLGAWGATKVLTLAVTIPPRVDTLTATPSPVSKGQTLTLTATNVVDDDGTIASVSFYRDVDGDGLVSSADKLLSTDTTASNGWSYSTASSNSNLITGVNRILAVAKDNLGTVSTPTLTLVTIDAPPTLSSFTASSSPKANAPITLAAKGSADITLMSIYLDNGDGLFTLASETYLGDAPYDSVANSWRLTLAPGTLTAGSLRLWARAFDGVGYSLVRGLSLTVAP